MSRVALLVEPGFLDRHVGVRNYLLSLHAHLTAAGHDAQLVSAVRPSGHVANWSRLHLRDPRFARDNGISADWAIRAPAADVMARFAAGPPAGADDRPPDLWHSQIGTRLEAGRFDVLVVGSPWAVDFDDRLPVPRVVGLAYDAIPTRFCLTGPAKPFPFAAQHARGFRYYRERCDQTLAISPAVADDLRELFHFPAGGVASLPPMVPPACLRPAVAAERRPGAVLLASPLDRRKGLAQMPALVGDSAGVLLLYGGVRCPPEDVPAFFAALPPALPVEWHPRATAATTERLFREAELLLFPSASEGLGLPLIEAQLRGCPAAARPRRPMSDLLVAGSRTLPGDPGGDRAVVREMLADTGFDHAGLEVAARRFFDVDTLAGRVAAAVVGTA